MTGLTRVDCGLHVAEPMKFPPVFFPLPSATWCARLPSNWYELAMLFTLSAKLDNATSVEDGTGVDASERATKSCRNSRDSSNSSESAGDRGADGIVGAALQDIVEPHGDSGPDQHAHKAYIIRTQYSKLSHLHFC